MARLNFRQGIVTHQIDTLGNQGFLSVVGGQVSLVVSPTPIVVAFVDGDTDYLFTEGTSVPNAWNNTFAPGSNYWLYWELDSLTAVRTFGFTILEPIEQSTAPSAPALGQMWFNTTANEWFEYNGATWIKVIRVFACKLDTILVPRSVSINAPGFKGTQVGITTSQDIGSLVFDRSGTPIRYEGKFFTTEDAFITGVPTGSSLKINNMVFPGVAQQPIGDYQVVEFSDFNKLIPASPFTQGSKVFGIVEQGVPTNGIVTFTTEGLIFNDDWDWVSAGASVNDPVFINSTGGIQLVEQIPGQLPVGSVIGPQEILFAPRLFPQIAIGGGPSGATEFVDLTDTPSAFTGEAGNFVRVNATESSLEFAAALSNVVWGDVGGTLSNQLDLQSTLNLKSDVGHVHTRSDITDFAHSHLITDVTGLQTVLNGKLDLTGGTLSGNLIMGAGTDVTLPDAPVVGTDAANKAYVDSVSGGGSGLPASTGECTVLISDGAGGWNENTIQPVPTPTFIKFGYTQTTVGAPPADTVVDTFIAPQDMVFFDYGHQVHYEKTSILPLSIGDDTSTFKILVNGAVRGLIGLFSDADSGTDALAGVNFGNGFAVFPGVSHMGRNLSINAGDVIELVTPSLPTDAYSKGIYVTLRGFMEPLHQGCSAFPQFTDVGKSNDASFEFYDVALLDTINMTYNGTITGIEWAVIGAVDAVDWPPTSPSDFKAVDSTGRLNSRVLTFTAPDFSFLSYENNRTYRRMSNAHTTAPNISSFSMDYTGGDTYFLVRCTTIGVGTIGADSAWIKVPANTGGGGEG